METRNSVLEALNRKQKACTSKIWSPEATWAILLGSAWPPSRLPSSCLYIVGRRSKSLAQPRHWHCASLLGKRRGRPYRHRSLESTGVYPGRISTTLLDINVPRRSAKLSANITRNNNYSPKSQHSSICQLHIIYSSLWSSTKLITSSTINTLILLWFTLSSFPSREESAV